MPLNSMRMLLDKLTCCRSQCSKTYCTEHHVKNIECNIKNTIKKKKRQWHYSDGHNAPKDKGEHFVLQRNNDK